jgi:dTDP-4-amino-4,6-dideoxygalactose transaminase/very-short-patch-repair endonuclease
MQDKDKQITVTSPLLPPLEEFIPYLQKIWDSKWITNNGQMHQQLERALADYLGVEYLSLFTNGTLPLITAFQALELKSGEVITTPYSFVATSHSIWWNGLQPVFVDVEPETGNMNPAKIEAAITEKTVAIMPVHVYGTPCKTYEIQKIADKYGLKVIYDAAHAFGVKAPQPPKGGAGPQTQQGGVGLQIQQGEEVFNSDKGGEALQSQQGCIEKNSKVGVLHSADPMLYPLLQEFAKQNRHNPTEAEEVLWNILRDKNETGYKFRRQHIVDQYIADFACIEKSLIIEVDGNYHNIKGQAEEDAARTCVIENYGYRVIRFTNEEVLYDTEHTLQKIKNAVSKDPIAPPSGGRGASILQAGDMSTLSFHATKVFSTIEGGALICHSAEMKQKIDHLKNFGFNGETEVVAPGINSKMDEVRAAFGLLNLQSVDAAIARRKQIAERYVHALNGIQGISLLQPIVESFQNAGSQQVQLNYGYFPIFVNAEQYGKTRDELYFAMKDHNVLGRRYFYPLISSFEPYKHFASASLSNLPVANALADSVICLPLHQDMSDEDVERVLMCIRK